MQPQHFNCDWALSWAQVQYIEGRGRKKNNINFNFISPRTIFPSHVFYSFPPSLAAPTWPPPSIARFASRKLQEILIFQLLPTNFFPYCCSFKWITRLESCWNWTCAPNRSNSTYLTDFSHIFSELLHSFFVSRRVIEQRQIFLPFNLSILLRSINNAECKK